VCRDGRKRYHTRARALPSREALLCWRGASDKAEERIIMRVGAVFVVLFTTAMIATAVPTAAAPGEGPSPEQLFKQFGLLGTWAIDCAAPASPANPHVEISEPAPGVVLEDQHLGQDYRLNRYSVLAADKVSDTELSVIVLLHPGEADEERQKLVFKIQDNTRRTLFTQSVGGPVRVKNGIVVLRGSPTPLLRKCR
jgi:hypothetical protein